MIWTPEPHHLQALDHLARNPRALLFLGMSLNKTSITLAHWIKTKPKALVIASDKVARFTWSDEVEKWSNFRGSRVSVIAGDAKKRAKALEADADIWTIGVDNLTWLIKELRGQLHRKFEMVIIDELSLFKSTNSQRFRKLKAAIKQVPLRIGLTGTPAPNGYVGLWPQVYLIDGGASLGDSVVEYRHRYFKERGNGQIVFEYIPRPGALEEIAGRLKKIALTMKTRDHTKLPDEDLIDWPVVMDAEARAKYDTLEGEMILELEREVEAWEDLIGEAIPRTVYAKTAADLGIKLQQLSGGALYESETREVLEVHEAKLDALDVILTIEGNVLLVYQFQHEVDRILRRYPNARKLRKAEDLREWNAGEIPLLLVHPASAGHGLNLQEGGHVIVWFSMTWNLEHYQQTNARLVRRGQPSDVVRIYRLITEGTRDRKIADRLAGKDKTQTTLFDDIKALRAKWRN